MKVKLEASRKFYYCGKNRLVRDFFKKKKFKANGKVNYVAFNSIVMYHDDYYIGLL